MTRPEPVQTSHRQRTSRLTGDFHPRKPAKSRPRSPSNHVGIGDLAIMNGVRPDVMLDGTIDLRGVQPDVDGAAVGVDDRHAVVVGVREAVDERLV